jgi:hypothetical protein
MVILRDDKPPGRHGIVQSQRLFSGPRPQLMLLMRTIYTQIRKRALRIAACYPPPDFYRVFLDADKISRHIFQTDPLISRLKTFVAQHADNDIGHGIKHAVKVTLDAGTLMTVEGRLAGYSEEFVMRRVLVVQCAALLHDIERKRENHAQKGAAFARKLLHSFPVRSDEIEDICGAIQNHEAFKGTVIIHTPEGLLVSDCLYDADKFRWGPDNFTDTVWKMVSFYQTPLAKFVDRYPSGMAHLSKIRSTFRTQTGQKYGPQFIDIGLAIGNELLEVIRSEFGHLL